MKIKLSEPEIKEIREYLGDNDIVVHMDECSAVYSLISKIYTEQNREDYWSIDWDEEFLLEDGF